MKRTVVYLTHWRIPSEKTMSPLITRTCAEFAKLGYTVELWVPYRRGVRRDANPFEQHHISPQFPIRRIVALDLLARLDKIGFFILITTFNWSAFVHLVMRRLSGERFIVYAHDMRDVVLPSFLGDAVFIEIHDYYESSVRPLNAFVLRRASGLIVTNTIKMKHIAERYDFPRARMIHQPNAVDADMFDIPQSKGDTRRILQLPEGRKIALYTGHLFKWKGVYTLAEAAKHLHNIWIYFVGGTDGDRAALHAYVREKNLPNVEFLAHQDHARIPLYLRAADVLVLPNTATDDASKYETSPVKLFEYMASGTPVVATDLPSIRELISDDLALLVPPDDPRAMAGAIIQTIDTADDDRAHRAQAWAAQHSWRSRAENIVKLIEANLA